MTTDVLTSPTSRARAMLITHAHDFESALQAADARHTASGSPALKGYWDKVIESLDRSAEVASLHCQACALHEVFQTALVRAFGKAAGDRRYDQSKNSWPAECVASRKAWLVAQEQWQLACDRQRELS